ncbi:vanin-like protein 1 [Eupeodes corollae]|uniref:vanin-like protein 1 n=1 Tax=Eupeodes corollae TaxID=290404 RepID=UPI0024901738|nr:vanin-like protein 1 [Eupeodes corollae]
MVGLDMRTSLCFLYFLFLIKSAQLEDLSASKSFYTAGVVEFAPAKYQGSFLDQLNDNLDNYIEIINSHEASTTDIIVFPELALNNPQYLTLLPEPKDNIIPCNIVRKNYEPFLKKLSCAVKNVRKYVVVNVLEKEVCTRTSQMEKNDPRPCAPNGFNSFNTNVVFNRDGMVIGRYRKYNSYDLMTNVTLMPELSTFETDFGVKFGMFICFDINFYSPAMELVDLGVKDFVYSSFWYSELPFLTGVQLHQSWAYANNVNLLAAGASSPNGGTTGSGIYSGRQGALVSVMANSPERKLYIANVTKSFQSKSVQQKPQVFKTNRKHIASKHTTGIRLMREYRMDDFTSELVEINNNGLTVVEKLLCHGSFCCQFNLELTKISSKISDNSYKYHLAVFDGDRKYSGFGYTKYKFCAVYACTGKTQDSCGRIFDGNTEIQPEVVFQKILIEGDFPKADKVLIMPNSLDQSLMPLSTDRFEFDIEDDKQMHHVKYSLSTASDDLLTFGIYANYYNGEF